MDLPLVIALIVALVLGVGAVFYLWKKGIFKKQTKQPEQAEKQNPVEDVLELDEDDFKGLKEIPELRGRVELLAQTVNSLLENQLYSEVEYSPGIFIKVKKNGNNGHSDVDVIGKPSETPKRKSTVSREEFNARMARGREEAKKRKEQEEANKNNPGEVTQ